MTKRKKTKIKIETYFNLYICAPTLKEAIAELKKAVETAKIKITALKDFVRVNDIHYYFDVGVRNEKS